jgi:autotransporter translocation and assembly factor TamB
MAMAVLILLVVAMATALLLFANTDTGRNFVEDRVASMNIMGQSIEIEGLSGSVFRDLAIDTLVISDAEGDWLTAKEIALKWRALSLLSKTVSIEELQIERIDVSRRPLIETSDEPGESPVDHINIAGFSIDEMDLAEPVLGNRVSVEAEGTVRHAPQGGQAKLSLSSSQGDIIESDLFWSDELVLQGSADITGPSDGLITNLLGLEATQTFSAVIVTDEPTTTIKAKVDENQLADLQIKRADTRIDVTGIVETDQLPALKALSPYLGGAASIEATLPQSLRGAGTFTLQSPRLSVTADGRRDRSGIEMDELNIVAMDVFRTLDTDGVALAELRFNGRALIEDTISLEGRAQLRDLTVQTVKVDQLFGPVTLNFDGEQLSFATDLTGRASQSIAQQAHGATLTLAGKYNKENQLLNISNLKLSFPGLQLSGTGDVPFRNLRQTRFDGEYSVNTRNFRDGPSARLIGRVAASRQGSGLALNLTGTADRFENWPDALSPLLNSPARYTADLQYEDEGLKVPQYSINNPRLKLTGQGAWIEGRLNTDFDYAIDRYSYADTELTQISGRGTLSGEPPSLRIDVTADASELVRGETTLTDVTAEMVGQVENGSLSADISATGTSPYGAATLTSELTYGDQGWSFASLQGQVDQFKAAGDISGVGGDIDQIRADLIVSGKSPFIPAENIDGTVQLSDSSVAIDLAMEGLSLTGVTADSLTLTATGPRNAIAYTLSADGVANINDLNRPLSLTASGTADLRSESLGGDGEATLSLAGFAFDVTGRADRQEDGWSAMLDASGLDGTMKLAFVPGSQGGVTYTIDQISVPKLTRLLARPVTEGAFSGAGDFQFQDGRVRGQSILNLTGLRSPIGTRAPVNIRGKATLMDEQLSIKVSSDENGLAGFISLEGPVETRMQAPFIQYPPTTPLQGTIDLTGRIGAVVDIFVSEQTDLTGQLDANATFSVPYAPTQLRGSVRLRDGVFEQGDVGLALRDISLTAELNGEELNVPEFSALGTNGGALNGSGLVNLRRASGSVNLKADNLRAISRREGRADVSGDITLSQADGKIELAGLLTVDRAEIDISRLPEAGLPTLDVQFRDPREDPEEVVPASSHVTNLDLKIQSSGRINVTGRGLDALMSLEARLDGPFDNPTVTGTMSVERGRFDFLSKRFEFRDSNIILRDDIMTSNLALEAVRRTSDLTAVVNIGGTFERPEIDLTAEPTLPDDEILSRILFGRSPTQLTAIETARLAAALTQLSGGSGFDLFGSLENAVGLDTLEIDQNELGQAQLTTGKYLADDVYLEVRSAAEGTPGVAVEWQVRDNIALEAETVPNESERLSIQWKRDFD